MDNLAAALVRLWFALWRFVERLLYRGAYSVLVPYGTRVFTPWFDRSSRSAFAGAYDVAARGGPMIVSRDRGYLLHAFARQAALLPGDFAECGVYAGGTAQLIAEAVRDRNVALHLFDTFAGMPGTADPDRDYHGPGDFGDTSLANVERRLAAYPFVRFHPGVIPDSLVDGRFAFVHIDVDIYPSTLAAIEWFWPRMGPGGIVICDDYGYRHLRNAAKRALDDYFVDEPEKPIALPTGQALIIRTAGGLRARG